MAGVFVEDELTLPLIIKEPIVYCDVDDTLVSWDFTYGEPAEDKLEFTDIDGSALYLKVIQPTVDALKSHAVRGHSIIIWSAGGADWARQVGRRLNLDGIVNAYLAKPTWVLDDLPASEFIPERIRRNLNTEKK